MDRQNRPGQKTGSGPVSESQIALQRKERQRILALDQIDVSKDPYLMRNHLGTYECKLCLTLHNTEGNYLAHTQGKRHQSNLARRKAMEKKELVLGPRAPTQKKVRKVAAIGRPGYSITRQRDTLTHQFSLVFKINYPEIEASSQPRHRIMSCFEQKIEAPDKRFQYVLFAADPYITIGFKIPNREIDKSEGRFTTNWNKDTKEFSLQLYFKTKEQVEIDHQKLLNRPAPARVIEFEKPLD